MKDGLIIEIINSQGFIINKYVQKISGVLSFLLAITLLDNGNVGYSGILDTFEVKTSIRIAFLIVFIISFITFIITSNKSYKYGIISFFNNVIYLDFNKFSYKELSYNTIQRISIGKRASKLAYNKNLYKGGDNWIEFNLNQENYRLEFRIKTKRQRERIEELMKSNGIRVETSRY